MKISGLYILLTMMFLHIVDDFYLQGILAKLKQKSWWEENAPDEQYKDDYKIALIEHAFSWAFMIMLPIMIYSITTNESIAFFGIMFIVNATVHGIVDHLKANVKSINLITDQFIHIGQILITCLIWCIIYL